MRAHETANGKAKRTWPGPGGPADLRGDPARVTDDTQMALTVGKALLSAGGATPLTPATVEGPLVAAVRRAATTSGDSDSIACLAGAFAGATCGLDAWPEDWRRRIEYRDQLDALAAAGEED